MADDENIALVQQQGGVCNALARLMKLISAKKMRYVWLGLTILIVVVAIIGAAVTGNILAWLPVFSLIVPIILSIIVATVAETKEFLYFGYWFCITITVITLIVCVSLLKQVLDFAGIQGESNPFSGFIAVAVITSILAVLALVVSVLAYLKEIKQFWPDEV